MKKLKGVILGLALLCASATFVGCNKEQKVVDFSIDTSGIETQLEYNEALDLSNIALKYKLEDGTEKEISSDSAELYVDMGGFNKAVSGKYTISYVYKGFKQSFDVTVGNAKVVNFRIDRSDIPSKVNYGENVDFSKLKAYAIREDGSEVLLDASEYTYDASHFNNKLRGFYTIQVLYGDYYEDYYSIELVAKTTGIELDFRYFPTEIEWGGVLDLRDLDVYLLYEDEGRLLLGPAEMMDVLDFDFGTFDSSVAGEHTITVTHKENAEFTKSFTITVAQPKKVGLTLDRSEIPEKVKFGAEVDFTKLKVYELYEDGSKELLEEGYSVDTSAFKNDMGGTYTIRVNYGEYREVVFFVEVEVEVVGIVVDIKNLTTVYDWGQDYSLEGLIIYTEFEDLTRKTISYADFLITIDDDGYDKTKAGVYTFTLMYNNDPTMIATFNIRVSDPLVVGFEVDTTNFYPYSEINEELNLDRLVVYMVREDGSKFSLQPTEYIVNTQEFNKCVEGDYTIYVSYKHYEVQSFVVTVKKLVTSLVALNSLEVALGGEVDLSQLSVKAIVNEDSYYTLSGDSDRLIIDLTNVSTNVVGEQTITITYKNNPEITTTFVLNVVDTSVNE